MTNCVRGVVMICVAASLSACGGVQIAPSPKLPRALVVPIPTKIGLLIAPDMRTLKHNENRAGVDWNINLGPGHEALSKAWFGEAFKDVVAIKDIAEAKNIAGISAVFEPRIEDYSFATARETGGIYVAVTINYRINLFTPDGVRYDNFTITGYGTALAGGMKTGAPLDVASGAAMRDAAAKFLVQFPNQPVAKQLATGAVLVAAEARTASTTSALDVIEAVPIEEVITDLAAAVQTAPAAAPATPSEAAPAT